MVQAIGSGASIALDKGVVFVNEDGSIDFNADGAFDDLKLGETETVSFRIHHRSYRWRAVNSHRRAYRQW